MREKIKQISKLGPLLDEIKEKGFKVVHCHGVFDLLHPGHIRHLQDAKKQGDTLVVTLTPDCFVNKGPGRPVFSENLRLEQVAALDCVDYVALNDAPDAVPAIERIKPAIYSKGSEYREPQDDITGKISEETHAVEVGGGKVHFTDDLVFSSSSLLNRFFDADAEALAPFLKQLKKQFSFDEVLEKIEALSTLKVLVVGDAIVDEYQYVEPLGLSGKGVHLAARLLDKETFLGGSLIIANHLAQFAGDVHLLTGVGRDDSMIRDQLDEKVTPAWIEIEREETLTKRRYVLRDGMNITKLFETYSSNEFLLNPTQCEKVGLFLEEKSRDYDLILACDFGNGFTNPYLIQKLSQVPSFLALNTQTNSGNRGYHVVSHYHRADFISVNEPELRLAAQDRDSRLETLAHDISALLHCGQISVTRGVNGVFFYSAEGESVSIPALISHSIDRVGAGDSYFALASLCACRGYPPLLTAFLGSVAAAMDVQIVGNKEAIQKIGLCKYVTRLLK